MGTFFEDLGKRLGETAETMTNKAGEAIGVVKGLIDNGVHDILDVKKPDGSSVLIPFVDSYFVEADLENRKIVLDWDPTWS